jgi:aspartate ammonia-lyase
VVGITANRELLAERVRSSAGLATALNPYLGYENATLVAQKSLETGRGVAELVAEMGLMQREELDKLLRPEVLTAPRHATK